MTDAEYIAILEAALKTFVEKIEIHLQSYDLDDKPDSDRIVFNTTWGSCRQAHAAMKERGKVTKLTVRGDEIHYERTTT